MRPHCLAAHEPTSRGRTALVRAMLVLVTVVSGWPACVQRVASPEDVEAAYILKFAGYVEWPDASFASASAPIVVGIVGSDRVHDLLADLAPGCARPISATRFMPPLEIRLTAMSPGGASSSHRSCCSQGMRRCNRSARSAASRAGSSSLSCSSGTWASARSGSGRTNAELPRAVCTGRTAPTSEDPIAKKPLSCE